MNWRDHKTEISTLQLAMICDTIGHISSIIDADSIRDSPQTIIGIFIAITELVPEIREALDKIPDIKECMKGIPEEYGKLCKEDLEHRFTEEEIQHEINELRVLDLENRSN